MSMFRTVAVLGLQLISFAAWADEDCPDGCPEDPPPVTESKIDDETSVPPPIGAAPPAPRRPAQPAAPPEPQTVKVEVAPVEVEDHKVHVEIDPIDVVVRTPEPATVVVQDNNGGDVSGGPYTGIIVGTRPVPAGQVSATAEVAEDIPLNPVARGVLGAQLTLGCHKANRGCLRFTAQGELGTPILSSEWAVGVAPGYSFTDRFAFGLAGEFGSAEMFVGRGHFVPYNSVIWGVGPWAGIRLDDPNDRDDIGTRLVFKLLGGTSGAHNPNNPPRDHFVAPQITGAAEFHFFFQTGKVDEEEARAALSAAPTRYRRTTQTVTPRVRTLPEADSDLPPNGGPIEIDDET